MIIVLISSCAIRNHRNASVKDSVYMSEYKAGLIDSGEYQSLLLGEADLRKMDSLTKRK